MTQREQNNEKKSEEKNEKKLVKVSRDKKLAKYVNIVFRFTFTDKKRFFTTLTHRNRTQHTHKMKKKTINSLNNAFVLM